MVPDERLIVGSGLSLGASDKDGATVGAVGSLLTLGAFEVVGFVLIDGWNDGSVLLDGDCEMVGDIT